LRYSFLALIMFRGDTIGGAKMRLDDCLGLMQAESIRFLVSHAFDMRLRGS
jgi:hypothetical protein